MLIRLALRFAALGLKFGLTIVIARTLGFDAVAVYGLAVAASVVASKLLGLGFSTELNRRLSASDPLPAIGEARRLGAAFGGLYLLICTSLAIASLAGLPAGEFGLSTRVLWCVLLVALSEHAAFETNAWMFSLHRARAGSLLLFVRTGAWAGIACAGLLAGAVRSIEAVFALWFACNACVVAVSWHRIGVLARRARHAGRTVRMPAARDMIGVWRHGLPFYAAGALLAILQYAERFIASGQVNADALGRYVFAWSVANAVQTVAFATVVATAAPGFVRVLADDPADFRRRLRRAVAASAGLAALISVAILAVHDDMFRLANKRAGVHEVALLAVLLASFVLRAAADVLWAAAIALRTGVAVTLSMAGVAAVCIPAAWYLIAGFGTTGAALAHLTASIAIIAALVPIVLRGERIHVAGAIRRSVSDAA
ncbi:polysaccharide biosynthesis protein [Burkholderia stabilis]|uniref:Polysaccharide biosynthesis protein n=1 Tax=Burkholderia stabilis TaxID=95485 RepID=A0A1Y1BZK9_9BURK|nr:polysaccharide biosynthesis protein [Burkholderia stabilis]BAX62987.1 polysaccharide biosynthesis protein [Burkholderia stabilis]